MSQRGLMSPPRFLTKADASSFAKPASHEQFDRTARALAAHGFNVEVVDDPDTARSRVSVLLPEGAAVFTAASETLRLSGIESDINDSGRFVAIKPRIWALDRTTEADEIRRPSTTPDYVLGSVSALTEDGP